LFGGLRTSVEEEDTVFDEFSWDIEDFFELVRHRCSKGEAGIVKLDVAQPVL
jgi:hypothetical protein